jgi:spore germination protein (amino acid permease)
MEEKLNFFHIILLTYMIQSGVVLLSLPSILAEQFGSNGWIILPFISAIALVNILVIGLVYKNGDGKPIFTLLEGTVPKTFLYPIYLFLIVVWTMLGCLIGKQYVLIFQIIAFPTTNPMMFKIVLDIIVFLLLTKGIYNITKATTVFFFMTFGMVFLQAFHLKELEFARYTSFLFYDSKYYIKGTLDTYTAFLGYELIILLFAFVNKKSKLIKGAIYGNIMTTFVYLSIALVCFGFYSFQQLSQMLFPVLDLLAYIKLPFIERIENLLFTFFLLKILITTTLYFWAAQQTLKRLFRNTKEKALGFFLVFIAYGISSIPKVLEDVNRWLTQFAYIEIGISFGLPLFCLFVLFIQRMKGSSQDVQK